MDDHLLTQEQVDAYLDMPDHCPKCGGQEFDGGSYDHEAGALGQRLTCLNPDCGFVWFDNYSLVTITTNNFKTYIDTAHGNDAALYGAELIEEPEPSQAQRTDLDLFIEAGKRVCVYRRNENWAGNGTLSRTSEGNILITKENGDRSLVAASDIGHLYEISEGERENALRDSLRTLADYLEETHSAEYTQEWDHAGTNAGDDPLEWHQREEPNCSYCAAIADARKQLGGDCSTATVGG